MDRALAVFGMMIGHGIAVYWVLESAGRPEDRGLAVLGLVITAGFCAVTFAILATTRR